MEPMENLRSVIESLLFVSDEPIAAKRVSTVTEAPLAEVETELIALREEYERDDRGFQLSEVAGGWRLFTHPANHRYIEGLVLSWDTRRLSQAALEALAVVAYHQPVTRQGVNAVRGVSSEGVLSSLIEKGLVKEVGRAKDAGNAILYGTSRAFLEQFGLKTLEELPALEQFAPDEETARAIRERLSSGDRSLSTPSEIDLEDIVEHSGGEDDVREID